MYAGNKPILIAFETPLGLLLNTFISQVIDLILKYPVHILWCDLR